MIPHTTLTPLAGKVALITGAGSGIGAAAATAYSRAGATVVLAGRREAQLEDVRQQIEQAGGQAWVQPVDVTDDAAVARLVSGIVGRCDRLDIAFNNAGMLGPQRPITDLDPVDFDTVMAVNLRAVWLLIKYEVAAMTAGGSGVIVNTGSFVAQASTPGTSIYAASKAALEAIVRSVALESGHLGIRINNVAPGVIRTPMSAGIDAGLAESLGGHAALKRLGVPEEVADVVVWLSTTRPAS